MSLPSGKVGLEVYKKEKKKKTRQVPQVPGNVLDRTWGLTEEGNRGLETQVVPAVLPYADLFLFRSDVLLWGPLPASMPCLSEKKWPEEGGCHPRSPGYLRRCCDPWTFSFRPHPYWVPFVSTEYITPAKATGSCSRACPSHLGQRPVALKGCSWPVPWLTQSKRRRLLAGLWTVLEAPSSLGFTCSTGCLEWPPRAGAKKSLIIHAPPPP